jgi:T1SS-143 domain-containing protein
VTATARNTSTNDTSSSNTSGQITVDAVADTPDLDVSNASGEQGTMIDLDISAALVDTDGSETLGSVRISGIPNGATLNNGSQVSSGVWDVPANQLGNLKINVPNNISGTYNLSVSVTSTERVTDRDFNLSNNTATRTQTLVLTVDRDDTPVITTPGSITSRESTLSTTNVITGQVIANFGGDGPGEFCVPSTGGFSASGAMHGGDLKFFHTPVVVTQSGDKYIGMAGNTKVFELQVTSSGSYTFRQFHTLDHQSPNNPNEIINLNFDIIAKDADGDTAVTTLTVRVQDTGPVANDDAVTMWTCDWTTIGNLITNYNQDGNGADQLSAEGTTVIQSVTSPFNETYGFSSGGDVIAVAGNYGYFYIFKDGSYAYLSWQTNPNSSHKETLSYKIVDSDGDVSQADLTVNVVHATVSPNHAADYNGFTQTNTTISGRAAYKTNITDGAMVFGDDDNDVLSGNNGNDIIRGWVGDDILYGSGGNDILMGEHGSNALAGGAGADLFNIYVDKANNATHDTIWDFNLAEGDVISLEQVVSGFGFNGDINDFVRIQRVGGDSMIQVNTDGQGGDFHNVALIKNETNLNAEDLFNKGHIDVY